MSPHFPRLLQRHATSAVICGVEGTLVARRRLPGLIDVSVRPDSEVFEPIERLAVRHTLVATSPDSRECLDRSLRAATLDRHFHRRLRLSGEDVLPSDDEGEAMARYLQALLLTGTSAKRCLVVDDAPEAIHAAASAGMRAAGMLQFVEPDEREERTRALYDAGAFLVVGSWSELEALHRPRRPARAVQRFGEGDSVAVAV